MTTYRGKCTDCVEIGTAKFVESLLQKAKHGVRVSALKAGIAKERRQLLDMSDSMLRDIGLTREQAWQEAQRVDLPESRIKTLNHPV